MTMESSHDSLPLEGHQAAPGRSPFPLSPAAAAWPGAAAPSRAPRLAAGGAPDSWRRAKRCAKVWEDGSYRNATWGDINL